MTPQLERFNIEMSRDSTPGVFRTWLERQQTRYLEEFIAQKSLMGHLCGTWAAASPEEHLSSQHCAMDTKYQHRFEMLKMELDYRSTIHHLKRKSRQLWWYGICGAALGAAISALVIIVQ